MRYAAKWPTYAQQWNAMAIKPAMAMAFRLMARAAVQNKTRYDAIEKASGVPWYMIAAIHRRESDADFGAWLGNGDPISHRSVHVPAGYGPFSSFEEGAVVALRIDGLTAVQDWRLEKVLFYCELFNGAGYDMRGLPSPYVWGGTNIQKAGKYVADGEWDENAWDGQPGCAPLIACMAQLDSSIVFVRESSGPSPAPTPAPGPAPPAPLPVPAHDLAWVQGELNRRGAALDQDGFYGPETLKALVAHFEKLGAAS